MRHLIIALLISAFATPCYSQSTEFYNTGNGLIYSDSTIRQLKFIVDSLNLKFKVCDLSRVYQSKFQAKANHISLRKEAIKEAKEDLDGGISFEDFIKKYPHAEIEKELLVVKFKYKDYSDNDVVEFSSIETGGKYEHKIYFKENVSSYDRPLKGKWLYRYYNKTTYSRESLEAFYFTDELTQIPMPVVYAKMIQYSDCMVDTSTQVFYDKAHRSGVRYYQPAPPKLSAFMDYINKGTNQPEFPKTKSDSVHELYWKAYHLWDSLRIARAASLRQKDKQFNTLLADAVKDVLENGGSNDQFEEYVGQFYSKSTALELKRSRMVIGRCSQDDGPRVHAFNIAILSAETTNWEIFLRSHLDIMNDRFERASDGSYAWGRRQTYIKELEVLDIDVLDLLLGISLRIENPSNNHYYGNIGRLGRALAETNKSAEIETKMLQMISDNQLDDYNRILIYYLFLNYNYYLENKEKQAANKEKLKTAIHTLPGYLATKVAVE